MQRLNGLMALVAFLSFGTMSTLAFADEEKKDEKKGGHVVVFGEDKKDEKKDGKDGHPMLADDDKDKKDDKSGK